MRKYVNEPTKAEVLEIYLAGCKGDIAPQPLANPEYQEGVFHLENCNGSLGYVASRENPKGRYWAYFESIGEAQSKG